MTYQRNPQSYLVALCTLLLLLCAQRVAAQSAPTPPAPEQTSWYEPAQLDPRLSEPVASKQRRLYTLGASYQVNGFVAGVPKGAGQVIDLSFGNRHIALAVGVFVPSSRWSVGFDLGRNWGFSLLKRGQLELAFMLPTLEVRSYWRWDYLTAPVISVGSSLAGLRLMSGRYGFDLRPRLDLWGHPSSRGGVALSVGGSASALMVF